MEKILIKISNFITSFRYLFLLLFIGLFVFGLSNINNVKVNNSLTDYLPSKTETKTGLKIMEKEFGNLISIDVMVDNVKEKEAEEIYQKITTIKNVDKVLFEVNDSYFNDNKALYRLQLINKTNKDAYNVKNDLKKSINKKITIYSDVFEDPTEGVDIVLALCIVIIVIVLLVTAKTYFEVVLAFIVFSISIALNMGTNFIFNEISYITKAIAIILQLALSIDYVIIFMNQYMHEIEDTEDKLLAIKKTLSKAIPEIIASSLTTISGLMALVFMQLKIGGDIGLVLSKGILCSLLTVILVMPSLLAIFHKLIIKLRKKEKTNINTILAKLTSFIFNFKYILLPIYIILIIFAILTIPNYKYVYNINSISSVRLSDNIKSLNKIEDNFEDNNTLVLLFKNKEKDYAKENDLVTNLYNIKGINKITSIGSYEVLPNINLGTKLNYLEAATLFNLDESKVKGLFLYYSVSKNEPIGMANVEKFKITIIDLITFIYDNQSSLPIDDSAKQVINNYYQTIKENLSFLESDDYSRMIISLNVKTESKEDIKTINEIKKTVKKYYPDSLLVGNSINARDLKDTFTKDNILITFVTILFIAIILMFTFKSFGMALLLILTIEGSILVNFGIVTLTNHKIFFMSYIVVSAIQMGATIDYAIVIASRYLQLRKSKDKKEAIKQTLHDRLSAVITSGLILLMAGFLVGTISTSSVVSSIGLFLGLGTLISLLATILFLPAILYLFDKFILKTTLKGK